MFQQATKAFLKISIGAVLAVLLPCTPSPVLAQGGSNDTPFVGQLMYIGFNYPPKGWAFCNGQLLPINQNQALFSLLGTTYGGDGRTNFALPNMQGRVPVHQGNSQFASYFIGQTGGSESATLSVANLPAHAHSLSLSAQIPASSAAATSSAPSGNALANTVHSLSYSADAPNVGMSSTVTVSGNTATTGSAAPQAFSTMPPYLTVSCIIALQGIFPSRN